MKVGVLGAGQLARMLAQAGKPLGMEFTFLCPTKDACAAAFGVHLCADYTDEIALAKLAEQSDIVTYEFENVPAQVVRFLKDRVKVFPSAAALAMAQDRMNEKTRFQELGIPTAGFSAVNDLPDLQQASEKYGLPAVLKTRTQGYDGKGQAVLRTPDDMESALAAMRGVPAIFEQWIAFSREISMIASRSTSGETVFYPVSENYHRDGMLRLSLSRRSDPMQAAAEESCARLLNSLDYVGTLALEMFQVGDKLLANEIAPRVHNSGHWTIEGALTSQFENHLRAIAGQPLGSTAVTTPTAMVNLIGKLPREEDFLAVPGAVPHFYGKTERPGRKVGHVTLIAGDSSVAEFSQRLQQLLLLAGETALAEMLRADADNRLSLLG